MSRADLTKGIALDLLDNCALAESDFSSTEELLLYVQDIIERHLTEYKLIYGGTLL